MHNVVGEGVNLRGMIYGSGIRCSQNPPLQQRALTSIKKYLGDALFPRYSVTPHSSLKWMNNAALEEATNRGVLVNTSQVGNF